MTILIKLGSFERTFTLVKTNAPERYDYGSTIHLVGEETPEKDSWRFVLISEGVEFQVGRYISGLYQSSLDIDELSEQDVQELLYKRLHKAEK